MNNRKMLERIMLVKGSDIVDTNSAATTGDYVSLKNYGRCLVVCIMGDGTAASDLDVHLYQATTVAGAGAKVLNCLETGRIYRKSAGTFTLEQALTGWTKVTQATADERYEPDDSGEESGIMAFEVMASDLDVDGGFDCIRADMTDPGASKYAVLLYILGDPVYPAAPELMKDPLVD